MRVELKLSDEDVQAIADAVAERSGGNGQSHPLAYDQQTAAAMIGVNWWVLRDLRRAGEIEASKVGRKWLYTHEELMRCLRDNSHGRGR